MAATGRALSVDGLAHGCGGTSSVANFEGKLWMPCCKTIVEGFEKGNTVTRTCPECQRRFVFAKDHSRKVIDAREV